MYVFYSYIQHWNDVILKVICMLYFISTLSDHSAICCYRPLKFLLGCCQRSALCWVRNYITSLFLPILMPRMKPNSLIKCGYEPHLNTAYSTLFKRTLYIVLLSQEPPFEIIEIISRDDCFVKPGQFFPIHLNSDQGTQSVHS